MRRGNVGVLIIIILLLASIIAVFVYKNNKDGEQKDLKKLLLNNSAREQTVQPQASILPDPKIDELIVYKLPSGWKKVNSNSKQTTIYADYTDRGGDLVGMDLQIKRSVNKDASKNLESLPIGGSCCTETSRIQTKIGGLDAIEIHIGSEPKEPPSLYYGVFKDDYVWEIIVYFGDLKAEDRHRTEIDDFIASIKFK